MSETPPEEPKAPLGELYDATRRRTMVIMDRAEVLQKADLLKSGDTSENFLRYDERLSSLRYEHQDRSGTSGVLPVDVIELMNHVPSGELSARKLLRTRDGLHKSLSVSGHFGGIFQGELKIKYISGHEVKEDLNEDQIKRALEHVLTTLESKLAERETNYALDVEVEVKNILGEGPEGETS